MTVTVRPVPARAWGNGIRPFQAIRPTNTISPYTLKTWRPPVPEPLPPAPLLGIPSLLAIGALVLSQIWGLFGSRPGQKTAPDPGTLQSSIQQPAPAPGIIYDVVVWFDLERMSLATPWGSCREAAVSMGKTAGQTRINGIIADPGGLNWQVLPASGDCGGAHAGLPREYVLLQGQSTAVWTTNTGGQFSSDWMKGSPPVFLAVRPGQSPSLGSAAPPGYVAPAVEPGKPVLSMPRLPAYLPTPAVSPAPVADPEPLPQLAPTSPGVSAPPSIAPVQARPPAPLRVPAAVPLTTAGRLPAPVPAAVPVTDPEAHYPVPGAPPVTGAGTRSTPAAMAQELGRMEQKVARLLNPGPGQGADGTDRLQLLSELAGRLLELLTSLSAGGSYEISSPCELDPDGGRIVTEVFYPGSLSALGVIGNKVDALAELLQAHKDLKQPICRPAPAAGQPVTVQFEQVE